MRIVILDNDVEFTVTSESCICHFRKSFMLPCKHIFKFRQLKELSLCYDSLCEKRLNKSFDVDHQRAFNQNSAVKVSETRMTKSAEVVKTKTN